MIVKASVKILEDNGKIVLKALGVTDEYISPEIIGNLAKYSVNQPILYRHVHPASPGEGQILGTVVGANLTDVEGVQGIDIEAEMLNYTEYQQKAIKYIKEKQDTENPIQISIGFQQFGLEEPIDARPYEFSLTDIPVCEECITYEVKTMANEKETNKDAVIAELKASLDNAFTENKELKAKVGNFEKEIKSTSTTLENAIERVTVAVSKQYEDKIKTQGDQIAVLTKNYEMSQKQPTIDKLFKLERDEELLEVYGNWNLEKLTARLEKKSKEAPLPIATKTINETQIGVVDKSMEDDIRQKARDVIRNDPVLNRYVNGDIGPGERGALI